MPVDFDNDTTLTDAIARLEGAEATEPPVQSEAFVQSENAESQQTATMEKTIGEQQPKSSETDTPATAENKPAEATEKDQKPEAKPEEKPADTKGKSKFAADKERLDKTWKSVNEQKTQLTAKEQALAAREQQIAQREQKASLAEAKARNKFTPEQYLQAGQNKLQSAESMAIQADGLDRRAEQLEQAGNYTEAAKLQAQAKSIRDQSTAERVLAKQMQDMAEHLKKNPDPTLEQHKATLENHKRHYLLEAAKAWPDVAVANSAFQKRMAEHLQAAAQQGLNPEENPSIFYHVARLTAAEAAAARVPDLEKKLGAATARVKELEALTSPGGGKGSAQTQPAARELTDAEEEQQLRQAAYTVTR